MSEPENSIDIVALGNSNLYSGFVPTILWEKYGYTSSVSAAPHQTPLESKMLLEQLLQSQKPQLVILETDMLYDGGAADENESVFSRFTTILNMLCLLRQPFMNFIMRGKA